MTLDEALSEAVCGARVRATNMQPGSYIDYNFNGWRINFEGGSSSGWTPRDIDREAEWVEVPIEAPKPEPAVKGGWGAVPGVKPPEPKAPPIGDVLIVGAAPPMWAPKKLDPNKGGW